jgi:hypothetical protein
MTSQLLVLPAFCWARELPLDADALLYLVRRGAMTQGNATERLPLTLQQA